MSGNCEIKSDFCLNLNFVALHFVLLFGDQIVQIVNFLCNFIRVHSQLNVNIRTYKKCIPMYSKEFTVLSSATRCSYFARKFCTMAIKLKWISPAVYLDVKLWKFVRENG
jgi:hypothetical protein